MSGTTSHWLLPYDLLADSADIEAVGKALADRLETVLNARFGTDPTSGGSVRTALGLAIGTDVQAHDSDLDAIAALSTTSFGRSVLTQANAAALRTLAGLVIGTDVQAHDADLDAIAALTSAANKLPYFTGSGAAALADLTAFARTLLDDADAATARATLGLGADVASAVGCSLRSADANNPFAGEYDYLALGLTTELLDSNGGHPVSGDSSKWTVPTDGWYQVNIHGVWNNSSAVGTRRVRLNNVTAGKRIVSSEVNATGGGFATIHGASVVEHLAANDVLQFLAAQAGTGAIVTHRALDDDASGFDCFLLKAD